MNFKEIENDLREIEEIEKNQETNSIYINPYLIKDSNDLTFPIQFPREVEEENDSQ